MPNQGERQITFLVHLPASQDPVVIATARDREGAKRLARPVLGHDPDRYIVQPLTLEGADVRFLGQFIPASHLERAAEALEQIECELGNPERLPWEIRHLPAVARTARRNALAASGETP